MDLISTYLPDDYKYGFCHDYRFTFDRITTNRFLRENNCISSDWYMSEYEINNPNAFENEGSLLRHAKDGYKGYNG